MEFFKTGILSVGDDGNIEVIKDEDERQAIADSFVQKGEIEPNYNVDDHIQNIALQRSKRKSKISSLAESSKPEGGGDADWGPFQDDNQNL